MKLLKKNEIYLIKDMNFFNFGKTKNEQLDENEQIRNLINSSKLNIPTTEEAIKAIISEFTSEQLELLEITSQLGRKISFEKQLKAYYGHYYPIYKIQTIKETLQFYIKKYPKVFSDKSLAPVFFRDRCRELFKNCN